MIHYDALLAGTPFRGLITQSLLGKCAYLGVPLDHYAADLEELEFDCHRGITFRGAGDGLHRPDGWFWYGWDYQHYGDRLEFPEFLLETLPPEMRVFGQTGKLWTIPEIEQDLIDAAIELLNVLQPAERYTLPK